MNFAPFNVLEFDGALSSVSIASWLPVFTQPGRLTIYAGGTDLVSVQVVKTIPRIPDPWRATSARPGPAPRKGSVIREPAGIVSSPPVFSYVAPPAAPSNAGFTIVPVPDPWRGTSTPLYGPQTKPFILTPFLSWQPTFVQPFRPILRAPGTVHVKDDWRFPEAVSADKWQATIVQASRPVLRAAGTTSVDRLLEIVFADKWQPTTVQPSRSIIYARGTDSVLGRELITVDKWLPTWIQPFRQIVRASGTDYIAPVFDEDTVADFAVCYGRLTLTSGNPMAYNTTGTTVYWTPYNGSTIGLFDGVSTWSNIKFVETSIAVPGSTGLYDVFAYNNSGTLALELSNSWSTTGNLSGADGSRTDALVLQDGIYVKSSAKTRRYLGTFYSLSGTSKDNYQFRWLWNLYNKIIKKPSVQETQASWAYTGGGTWRPSNNNANGLSYMQTVVGISGSQIYLTMGQYIDSLASTAYALTGFGYDSSTVPSYDFNFQVGAGASQPSSGTVTSFSNVPNIGLHSYYTMEVTVGGSATFHANSGTYQGVSGEFPC